MAPLKILICGGGCAGPALAYWLANSGHRVVIVERFAALRASGAQIDLRAQGIEVVKRMGLLDVIRSKLVDEDGTSFVDTHGNVLASVMANKSGQGAQSLTSEYEIMRGDLVRVLYDATKDKVEYVFGKTVDSFEQDDDQVVVHFSDGSSDTYDILVGADGQGSYIRKAIAPANSPDPYRRLGIYMAYWFVSRTEEDNNMFNWYNSPGGRVIHRRSHSPTESQAYFVLNDDSEDLHSLFRSPVEQQKKFLAQRFHDAGWHAERFIEGMKTTENFYCQEIVQVCTDTWHKGRVVLLGDAANCPSSFSGMGTTSCFVGAYVLAGEINRNTENLPQAFANYDKTLRPFVKEAQKLSPSLIRLNMPKTEWGVAILRSLIRLVCFLRIPDLISRFSNAEKGGWRLPDYPELKPMAQRSQ